MHPNNSLQKLVSGYGNMSDNETIYMDLDSILDDFHDSLYTHTEPRTILLVSAYIPVFLLALIGNLLVLFVILTTSHMRSLSNYFLFNLSIADLLGK